MAGVHGTPLQVTDGTNTFPALPPATQYSLIGAATTNATVVKSSAGRVYSISVFSLDATPVYLKLYNKATAPDENDTPVKRLMIPAAATAANGAGFVISFPGGLLFSAGIAFRTATGIADNSTGALSANEVLINIDYN